jgi:hypothetical protein
MFFISRMRKLWLAFVVSFSGFLSCAASAADPLFVVEIAPATSLVGSARDQVRADGSLLQPKSRGPLAGLREKLGG